jgi:hypothetical protein
MVSEIVAETERAEPEGAEDVSAKMHALAERSAVVRRVRAAALEELCDLPELTDVASAKAILAHLVELAVADQLAGSKLLAATRAVEVYLKACSDEQDRGTLLETRALLKKLQAERALAARRGGA